MPVRFFCEWTMVQRDANRFKISLLSLNCYRLTEKIPSRESFNQEVNRGCADLQKVLEEWRDHHISTFTQCHKAVKEQVAATILRISEQSLDLCSSDGQQKLTSSEDPFDKFMLTGGGEISLLDSIILKDEAAIAEACTQQITSDLSEVQDIFRREYSDRWEQLKRGKDYEALEKTLDRTQKSEKDWQSRCEQLNCEQELLKKRLQDLQKELQTANEQTVELNKAHKREEDDLQQKADFLEAKLADAQKRAEQLLQQYEEITQKRVNKLEESAKSREEKYSGLKKRYDANKKEKEGLKVYLRSLLDEKKRLEEALTRKKAKLKGKKDRIQELEQQLSVIKTMRGDQVHRYASDPSLLEEGRETEGNSMRESQNKLAWKCPSCEISNHAQLKTCKKCLFARPGLLCLYCGAYNERPDHPSSNPSPRQAASSIDIKVQGIAILGAPKQAQTFPPLLSSALSRDDDIRRSNTQL